MAERKLFTHWQVGVAGVLGSPLAAAALASWNLTHHRSRRAGVAFLFLFFAFLLIVDTVVGVVGSTALGAFGFMLLLLVAMLVNFVVSPTCDDLSPQSWIVLLPVVLSSLLLCTIFRYWIAKFISFP